MHPQPDRLAPVLPTVGNPAPWHAWLTPPLRSGRGSWPVALLLWIMIASPGDAVSEPVATVHASPAALPDDARTADWPGFLGPRNDATTDEEPLALPWPEDGPTLLWELAKGGGYASPVISDGRLLLFHLVDGEERIDCLDPVDGSPLWSTGYAVDYRDRYGYSNGPRGSPWISGDRAVALGVTSMLTCVSMDDGSVLWQHDLRESYGTPQDFFGHGSSPLIDEGRVFVQVGGREVTAMALSLEDGRPLWELRHAWGASYASPVLATLHGRELLLLFAGGESRPPVGGLLVVDPDDGALVAEFPWRAGIYESVNAANPVVFGDGRIFLTECYGPGGVMLQLTPDFELRELWRSEQLDSHWTTPVVDPRGRLLVVAGRHQRNAWLRCVDPADGTILWQDELAWTDQVNGRDYRMGFQRGSLVRVPQGWIGLGEMGGLLFLRMEDDGPVVAARHQPFLAPETWSPPAISQGLLYVCQHHRDMDGNPPRLLCFDLRPAGP